MMPNRLRQIAILVDSLDTPAADRLLDQLPESLQQRVRDAVMNLDDVLESERETVLADFRRGAQGGDSVGGGPEPAPSDPALPAPTYQPAWRAGRPSPAVPASRPEASLRKAESRGNAFAGDESPVAHEETGGHASTLVPPHREAAPMVPSSSLDLSETLSTVDMEMLASVVLRESPQVLAAVLSLLPPSRSAQLLEFCPDSLRSAALERLHYLEELDDEVVHLLQQELSLVIRQKLKLKQKQRIGSQALAEIMVAAQQLKSSTVAQVVRRQLQGTTDSHRRLPMPATTDAKPRLATVSDGPVRAATRPSNPVPPKDVHSLRTPDMLDPPSASAGAIAERLVSNELEAATALADYEARLSFAELVDCDAGSLQALLATAKPQLTLLALRGASQALLDRVLKMLPKSEAKEVQFRVQNLGPTRVHDIQQAQQYLLRLASLLEDMGRFRRPRTRARSAA